MSPGHKRVIECLILRVESGSGAGTLAQRQIGQGLQSSWNLIEATNDLRRYLIYLSPLTWNPPSLYNHRFPRCLPLRVFSLRDRKDRRHACCTFRWPCRQ